MGIQFTGLASGLDTQSIISDLMKVERMRVENVKKEKILTEWRKEAWDEMNAKLYSFYKTELFEFKSQGTYSQKALSNSNESLISMNNSAEAVRGSHAITINQMAKGSFLTGGELTTDLGGIPITSSTTAEDLFTFVDPVNDTKTLTISTDGGNTTHDVTIVATDTITNIVDKVNTLDLELDISFDSNFNRLFLSSTETGSDVQLELSGDDEVLTNLGFAIGARAGSAGSDAEFNYNGTDFTSSSNEINVNGLSFDILEDSGSATVTVTQDTDAVYESVKSFVLKYNELMVEFAEKIGAESTRGYEPLTDEEKLTMSEDDIKLWEAKIKDSLLRRDDNLTSISNKLRNTLTLSSGIDTTDLTYKTLSSLGIVTGGYQENGLLHIEGDEDDPIYGLKDNKLREAINEDFDAVTELMTALGDELYSDFGERMKSSFLSSALTFHNDKEIDRQIEDYEDEIFNLEGKLSMIEERYYKQFTAMEQAIQRANSTGEWLAQQLGGMS